MHDSVIRRFRVRMRDRSQHRNSTVLQYVKYYKYKISKTNPVVLADHPLAIRMDSPPCRPLCTPVPYQTTDALPALRDVTSIRRTLHDSSFLQYIEITAMRNIKHTQWSVLVVDRFTHNQDIVGVVVVGLVLHTVL